MRALITSAPGKLVLCGEYAVLDGAAAIAVALDRRAIVSIKAGEDAFHTLAAPGFSDTPAPFTVRGGIIRWIEGGSGHGLFEQVWTESRVSAPASIIISLDTRAFRDEDSGGKLGIGSSAALSAALATALHGLGGEDPAEVAMRAHRGFQGGSGSGVDVAASLAGGVLRYRIGDERPHALAWPEGLYYSVYWSGTPADTRGKLERLHQQPESLARRRLAESADRFATVFAGGNAAQVLTELQVYCESLRQFDAGHGLGIYGAGHAGLADVARDGPVVYKPCGAGGGDIGIALATSQAELASFSTVAARAGFRQLVATIDPCGAELIEEDHE